MQQNKIAFIIFLIIVFGGVIRLYTLTGVPVALHGDELGVGYNAYSLLLTGKDEYGNKLPFVFRNDFSPLIHYATLPSVYLFGLNELSTRLPTALIGILTIISVYFFTLVVYRNQKLALITAFLIATSSWHIRTSRIAVEMTWALFFQITAATLFVYATRCKQKLLNILLSFLFFSFSVLSYQTAKLITPLLALFLILKFPVKNYKDKFFIFYIVFIISPILIYFYYRPISEMRFAGISVFTVWKSTLLENSKLSSYLNIQALGQLTAMIIKNYFTHFSPSILFTDNSMLRYYQIKGMGLFYLWEAFFIPVGLVASILKIRKKEYQLSLFILIISPIAASFTTGVPNANVSRALIMLPILILFVSTGILFTCGLIKRYFISYLPALQMAIVISTIIAVKSFVEVYYLYEPNKYAEFWGLHLKEAALRANAVEDEVDRIIFTTSSSPQGYMYVLFYGKKDPLWLIKNKGTRAEIVGYSSFGKYIFRPVNWDNDRNLPNTLLIGTTEEIPVRGNKNITEINSQGGKPLLRVVRTDRL